MADNTLLDLHNSSEDTQPHSIIVKYYSASGLLYALSVEWCNQSITQANKQAKRRHLTPSRIFLVFFIKCAVLRDETQ